MSYYVNITNVREYTSCVQLQYEVVGTTSMSGIAYVYNVRSGGNLGNRVGRIEYTWKGAGSYVFDSLPNDWQRIELEYANIEDYRRNGIQTAPFILYKGYTDPPTPLSTPTGLTKERITSTSARVGWQAVSNATGYKVEYRPVGNTTWTTDPNQ